MIFKGIRIQGAYVRYFLRFFYMCTIIVCVHIRNGTCVSSTTKKHVFINETRQTSSCRLAIDWWITLKNLCVRVRAVCAPLFNDKSQEREEVTENKYKCSIDAWMWCFFA